MVWRAVCREVKTIWDLLRQDVAKRGARGVREMRRCKSEERLRKVIVTCVGTGQRLWGHKILEQTSATLSGNKASA